MKKRGNEIRPHKNVDDYFLLLYNYAYAVPTVCVSTYRGILGF